MCDLLRPIAIWRIIQKNYIRFAFLLKGFVQGLSLCCPSVAGMAKTKKSQKRPVASVRKPSSKVSSDTKLLAPKSNASLLQADVLERAQSANAPTKSSVKEKKDKKGDKEKNKKEKKDRIESKAREAKDKKQEKKPKDKKDEKKSKEKKAKDESAADQKLKEKKAKDESAADQKLK